MFYEAAGRRGKQRNKKWTLAVEENRKERTISAVDSISDHKNRLWVYVPEIKALSHMLLGGPVHNRSLRVRLIRCLLPHAAPPAEHV